MAPGMRARLPRGLASTLAVVLIAGGCTGQDHADHDAAGAVTTPSGEASPAAENAADEGHGGHHAAPGPTAKPIPLRAGERRSSLRLASAYTPQAPYGVGTDDYRCFLLDPDLRADTALTGFDIRPDNLDMVHHVILFRVPAAKVAKAEALDGETEGEGWTCFGGSGLEDGPGEQLDDAGWLGAWAPGGGEQRYRRGLGIPLERGDRVVAQIHYNLLGGEGADRSGVVLRTTGPRATRGITPLSTMLLPAPVELPCRPDNRGPLCEREAALADVKERFGSRAGATADLLHFLCGSKPAAATEQTCTRTLAEPMTVRGVAGHMHLLGTSIRIDASRAGGPWETLLDVPVWNFDDQGSRAIDPVRLNTWDKVRVTCRHAQWLRDQQPSFEAERRDRYVLWGEGSTDEMCLGMLLTTQE